MIRLYLTRYAFLLMILASSVAMAQQVVTGKVTSGDDGSSIPGVNIVEKGTSNGTVTDVEGNYNVTVGSGATLIFSFVGYVSQEIAIGGQSSISVTLKPDVTNLSEVVVIGYGEVNRRDATGAVASVKSEAFNRGIIASPEQLIQGKTAGVQITSSSGEPGAGVNLRIRGTSSVRGGNNPLFVVDGIPLSDDNTTPGGSDFGRGGQSAKNPLNFINPNDIESIDILKDASATAIYGSRGANGVVIITTKGGKGKKQSLEYSATVSISQQAKYYDVLDAGTFVSEWSKQNPGIATSTIDYGADTDWQKEINRTAVSQNHNVSYSNSYKTGNYRASINYDDQVGIIKNSGMERYTGRLNLNQNFLHDKLKFSAQTLFSRVNDQAAPITTSAGFEGDLIGGSIIYNPTIPATPTNFVGNTDVLYSADAANPLSQLKYYKDGTKTDRQLINLSLGYDITKELNFKVNTGFDRSHSFRTSAMSGLQNKISNVSGTGRAFLNDQKNANDLLEAFFNYNKKIGENPLTVLLGYSYQSFDVKGRNANAANFGTQTNMDWMIQDLVDADKAVRDFIPQNWNQYEYDRTKFMRVYDLYSATSPKTYYTTGLPFINPRGVTGNKYSYKDELQSFFARGNYNVAEKYFFTASVRADGSTRFGGNNKYGIFPSGAVKYRMSDEAFIPDVFDELAVRIGYGVTGNQSIGHNLYTTRQQWATTGLGKEGNLSDEDMGPNDGAGLNTVTYGNPDLQWEQTRQLNIGVDYGFFGSRINGSLDFYHKNTTKLLMQVFPAQPSPTPFTWQNLDANVINSGVELTVNGVVADKKDFGLNLTFNVAYNKNIVKNYDGPPLNTGTINGQGLSNSYAQRIANNQSLFTYYVRNWTGFGADGLNTGGDGQEYVGKSAIPKVNAGFSLSLRVYKFDFAAYMYGQFGQYIYNNLANAYFTTGSIAGARNVIPEVVTTNESKANSPDVSTRFLEKGDFIRMQNLSLGYSTTVKDFFINKVRFSVTGQNLFVITDYSGRDPEVNVDKNINGVPSLGIDYTSYPRARTVSFSLNATF